MLKKFTSTLLLSTFLTACGGGGGGGNDGNVISSTYINPPFSGTYSPELQIINISPVHNINYTGQGVVIGIIDDGFYFEHEALEGKFTDNGIDYGENDSNAEADYDEAFHGTMVASAAVGKAPNGQVLGPAYNAKIIPIKVFNENDGIPVGAIADGINYARSRGADIVNISVSEGWAYSSLRTAVQNAAATGMAITFAAGNFSQSSPEGGVGTLVADGNGHVLAVGALNSSGTSEADWGPAYNHPEFGLVDPGSSRCGNTYYCLFAPGTNISLADVGGGYEKENGTSFASPMVAGVLATMAEAFPTMSGDELIWAVLQTADDLGAVGYDTTYGWGRINAEEAFRAQGKLSIATGKMINDTKYDTQNTVIALAPSFGDALKNNSLLAKAVSFDSLNKPYRTDLNYNIKQADHSLELLGFLERDNKFSEHSVNTETISLGFGVLDRSDDYLIKEPTADFDKNEVTYVSFSSQINERLGFSFSNNQTTGMIDTRGVMLSSGAFSEPYLNQQQASVNYKVSENIKANFIASSGDDIRENTLSSSLAYNGNDYVLNFNVGFKNEDEGFLGAESDGAFNTEDGTTTSFFGVSGQYHINDNLRLVGQYTSGVSKIASNSLIDNFSNVRSDAYGIGLISQHKDKSFGAVFSQPLKVYSGSADLTIPTGRDVDQNVIYETERVDLTSSGTERDIELFYNQNISNSESIALNAMARLEPGHSKYNDDEYIVTAKYSLKF